MRESPESLFSGVISAPEGSPEYLARRPRFGAFTIIEVLIVIGIVSVLAGVSVVVVNNTREATRVSKLNSDVATVNAAIQVYRSQGGTLPNGPSPQEVLDKLKTKASTASAAQMTGLKGSVIDERIKAELQDSSDAGTSQERAVWDSAAQRFVVTSSGAAGVKRFVLDDALGEMNYGSETRNVTNPRGTNTKWVWDYHDTVAQTPAGPVTPGSAAATATPPPTAETVRTLAAPTFSLPQGSYALTNFDLSISLADPNPSGVSQIWYSAGGPETRYTGAPISVAPGATVTAMAKSIDPDHWSDSSGNTGLWSAIPYQPTLSVSPPSTTMTYAQAGGAMTMGSTTTPSPATVAITNFSGIPAKYRNSSKFQVYYTVDGSSPLTSGVAGPAFSGTYASPSISVALANWGTASSIVINAAARAIDTTMFTNSRVATASIGINPTGLASPAIDPPSGSKAADLPVSIALVTGQNYPVGARIYYTIDGTDPGNTNGNPTNGTLYNGQFNSGAGTNGVVVVSARVYGPAGYGQWFTPSAVAVANYATITLADGALVGNATLNGTFVGSLVYASPAAGGSMNSITFNSGSRIMSGNLYLPGTPTVRKPDGTVWSTAKDSQFSANILGWEFNSSGVKTVQTTPRVLDENGSATPNNYSVSFNNNAVLEGKVIRRHDSPAFPVIAPPPAADSNGSINLNSPPSGPISASQYASVTINSSSAGNVRLNAGHYANLNANSNTAFVLGDPLNPEITQIYSFQSLNLNSPSSLKIVGKVIVTVGGSINVNNGSVLGNADHPEWLQLQFSSGSFTGNSGSTVYAQLVNPTGSVTFNSGSVFNGSVTAQSLTINSNGVVFSLPPVIQN